MTTLNIVNLIENNPIIKLSPAYTNRFISKIKDNFTETQQQIFVSSFYCYLNYNQTTDFVIDLDNIWGWLGFSTKQKAKMLLEKCFVIDKDYLLLNLQVKQTNETRGGHNKQTYLLNIRTFKLFCIKAETEKASEIHDYFVKLEDIMNEILKEECTELKNQLEKKDNLINQSEIEKEIIREKTLIEQFPDNTQCIYYGKIDNVSSNNEKLIKFGCSNFLSNRIDRHKKTFSNFRLLNVFKVDNKNQIENAIKQHNVLSSFRRAIQINNVCYNELLSVQQLSFEELDKIIKDIITDTEYNPEKYKILLKECESFKRTNNLLVKELERVKKITAIPVEEFNMIKSQNLLLSEENLKLKLENEKLLKKYKINDKRPDKVADVNYNNISNSLKRIAKSSDGLYHINNQIYDNCFGTREDVWNETAYKTTGGLTKSDLMVNKNGKIISKKKFITEKEYNRLENVNNVKKELAIKKQIQSSSVENH
jgi:phage anti-repressor protein